MPQTFFYYFYCCLVICLNVHKKKSELILQTPLTSSLSQWQKEFAIPVKIGRAHV